MQFRLARPTYALILASFLCACSVMAAQQPAAPAQTAPAAQTTFPLDPQMAKVIQAYKMIAGTPIYDLSPQDARQQFSAEDAEKAVARATGVQKAPEPVAKIVDQMIPGPGGPLPIRIYTPSGTGPFPVVVYYHGGGFVIATIDTYDATPRAIANLAHAVVVSVEYRKAPEHKFPAAVNDAFAAYKWVLQNAGSFNGDGNRVAVLGESAGGNLAAVVCIEARDQGVRMPVRQVLVYPVTQYSLNTYSDVAYANATPLNLPALKWFYGFYLSSPADANNPLAAPLKANLRNLPGATIIAAEIDPLGSDGRQYAIKLKDYGVPVNYKFYSGVTHEFFGMGAVVDKAKQAEQQAAADLRTAFHE